MRLSEIKKVVSGTLNGSNQLEILSEAVYGGQAYQIDNFGQIMNALELLEIQDWNKLDFTPIKEIRQKYRAGVTTAQLSAEDFSILNSYVTELNKSLPIYVGIIETIVYSQDEQTINIKLPDELGAYADFNKLSTRLEKIFKEFNIDGRAEFAGVDRGSAWIAICLTGAATYHVFIGCLKVAQEFYKTRTEYFKSATAQLDYENMLNLSNMKKSQIKFDQFAENRMNLVIEKQVKEVLEKVGETNGKSNEERQSHIIKATKDLAEALGDNVEFHLSLNPPSYATEDNGHLSIDYTAIQKLNEAQPTVTKQIEASKQTE